MLFKVESSYRPYLCSRCHVWFFSEKLLSAKIAWMCSDCATTSWFDISLKQAPALDSKCAAKDQLMSGRSSNPAVNCDSCDPGITNIT